jgi:hypothetical protein
MINEYIQIYVTSIRTYVITFSFHSGDTIVFFCTENILKLQLIRQTFRKLMNNFQINPVD